MSYCKILPRLFGEVWWVWEGENNGGLQRTKGSCFYPKAAALHPSGGIVKMGAGTKGEERTRWKTTCWARKSPDIGKRRG